MKFTIETVSKMTGISSPSLRNWEKRYGFPNPIRTESGHRFYTVHDIEFLKQTASWLEEGYSLSQIAEFYKSHHEGKESEPILGVSSEMIAPVPASSEICDDVSYRTELTYQALLKYDHQSTQQHYSILNAKLSPEQLFDRVFEPILRRLGREWAQGKITIAQEHFASNFLRLKLASFLAIEFPATHSQPILAASLAGEKHEGGLLLVAAHLKFRGYPVFYFGIDLPFSDLQTICSELKPKVVTLSYLHFDRLQEDLVLLGQLPMPVVIGGLAVCDQKLDSLRQTSPSNIHFCEKKIGSEAAHFVELICQSCKKY